MVAQMWLIRKINKVTSDNILGENDLSFVYNFNKHNDYITASSSFWKQVY